MIHTNCMLKVNVDWNKIQAVIFDVDGTLYSQRLLRLLMLRDLLAYYLIRPSLWKDMLILGCFRSLRYEMLGGHHINENLLKIQFRATAEKIRVPIIRVEACIEKWMMVHPLKYLRSIRYPGVLDFYNDLRESSIKLAAFSDYPVVEKLCALDMPEMISVCTTDPDVNSMKPDTKGLLLLVKKLAVPIDTCLLIGDREDKDGECAREIYMPYLIKTNHYAGPNHFTSYKKLNMVFGQSIKDKATCTQI